MIQKQNLFSRIAGISAIVLCAAGGVLYVKKPVQSVPAGTSTRRNCTSCGSARAPRTTRQHPPLQQRQSRMGQKRRHFALNFSPRRQKSPCSSPELCLSRAIQPVCSPLFSHSAEFTHFVYRSFAVQSQFRARDGGSFAGSQLPDATRRTVQIKTRTK